VTFESYAGDLVATDTNADKDVFVRDLTTGVTRLVSARADGHDAGNGASSAPTFSPDGKKVVFTSSANDLGPEDHNGTPSTGPLFDVYIRDLTDDTTSLVSSRADGSQSANDVSAGLDVGHLRPGLAGRLPMFTASGRVVFVSFATDLGPTDTNGESDLFIASP
jgi:hypothetical protein